jgi:hypothetical protein
MGVVGAHPYSPDINRSQGLCDAKFPQTIITSTTDWRAYWQRQGVDWRSVIKLHVEICDRLRASSSWWSS